MLNGRKKGVAQRRPLVDSIDQTARLFLILFHKGCILKAQNYAFFFKEQYDNSRKNSR